MSKLKIKWNRKTRKKKRKEKKESKLLQQKHERHVQVNLEQLKKRCLASEEEIGAELGGVTLYDQFGDPCYYKDNGSDVLAVAHMDTVQNCMHFGSVKLTGDWVVYNAKLDDRFGVYTIMDLLPSLGIKTDILLSTNEEKCMSTADALLDHKPKKYNWMVSFDREGEDVVLYQYRKAKKFKKSLIRAGFTVGWGSYSDICGLGELMCCGFNVGTGLVTGHSKTAHAFIRPYIDQIERFCAFYDNFKERHFFHDGTDYYSSKYGGAYSSSYYSRDIPSGNTKTQEYMGYDDEEELGYNQIQQEGVSAVCGECGSTFDSTLLIDVQSPSGAYMYHCPYCYSEDVAIY